MVGSTEFNGEQPVENAIRMGIQKKLERTSPIFEMMEFEWWLFKYL